MTGLISPPILKAMSRVTGNGRTVRVSNTDADAAKDQNTENAGQKNDDLSGNA